LAALIIGFLLVRGVLGGANPTSLTATAAAIAAAQNTSTPTITPSATSTFTFTPSLTATPTNTPSLTSTPTSTFTATHTATPTQTDTPTPSLTPSLLPGQVKLTETMGQVMTQAILVASYTKTPEPTSTPTASDTPLPTATATLVPSEVPSETPSPNVSEMPLNTVSYTATNLPTTPSPAIAPGLIVTGDVATLPPPTPIPGTLPPLATLPATATAAATATATPTLAPTTSPALLRDPNGLIVFSAVREPGKSRIFVMDSTGQGQQPISEGPKDYAPAWSHDGKRIAFLRLFSANMGQIMTLHYDPQQGTFDTPIACWKADARFTLTNAPISWSPDGKFLVVTLKVPDTTSTIELYTLSTSCTQAPKQITTVDNGFNSSGNWSLANQIIFASTRPTSKASLFIVTMKGDLPDGGSHDWGNPDKTHGADHPVWSPDGQFIAYSTRIGANANKTALHYSKSDGSGTVDLVPDISLNDYPTWSPDGTKIAFVSDRVTGKRLYYVELNMPVASVPLTTEDGDMPSWQPVVPTN
jgi:hypothetical protein